MSSNPKQIISAELSEGELRELDQVCGRQKLTRTEAIREAILWYVGAIRRLPAAEDPLPEEIEAIRLGEEEFAAGRCRRLEDIQRELGLPTK